MPGLSGPEAFLAIRGIRPGIKGILCSGDTPAALGTSVREHGFLAFLKKPFSLDQLRNALAAAGLPAAEPRPGGTGPDPGAARR
jgi:DNA-binding NtrC family response regulator